jgi:hypothetical protein
MGEFFEQAWQWYPALVDAASGWPLAPLCRTCLARTQADLAVHFAQHVSPFWKQAAVHQAQADAALLLGEDNQAIEQGRAASRSLWMALRFNGAAATAENRYPDAPVGGRRVSSERIGLGADRGNARLCGMTRAHSAFKDLVWPAAAGNVAWSFVTLALSGPWVVRSSPWSSSEWELAARLATLSLLAWYLGSEWLHLVHAVPSGRPPEGFVYWLGDGLLVFFIVVLANALVMRDAWTELLYALLSFAFVVAALWHLYNGWPESEFSKWGLKFALNLIGFGLLWLGYAYVPASNQWPMVAALFVVLAAWSILGLDKDRKVEPA